jgi:hypothetical protein
MANESPVLIFRLGVRHRVRCRLITDARSPPGSSTCGPCAASRSSGQASSAPKIAPSGSGREPRPARAYVPDAKPASRMSSIIRSRNAEIRTSLRSRIDRDGRTGPYEEVPSTARPRDAVLLGEAARPTSFGSARRPLATSAGAGSQHLGQRAQRRLCSWSSVTGDRLGGRAALRASGAEHVV